MKRIRTITNQEYEETVASYQRCYDVSSNKNGMMLLLNNGERVFATDSIIKDMYNEIYKAEKMNDIADALEERGYSIQNIPEGLLDDMVDEYVSFLTNEEYISLYEAWVYADNVLEDHEDDLEQYKVEER